MLNRGRKQRPKRNDSLLAKLGYYTDNGAYYYARTISQNYYETIQSLVK